MLLMFVVLFVILTIIISLYASGYKLNLSWPPKFNKLLQKTGMLVVGTVPKGATIYLNGTPQQGQTLQFWNNNYLTTPSKIKGLLPDEYTLRLERDGYWPLEKKIRIEPGQTTFAENLNLFSSSLPLIVAPYKSGSLELSPNRRYLYVASEKKIINLKTGQERILPDNTGVNGTWLKSDRLLSGGWVFDPEKTTDTDYQQIIGAGASDWYYEETSGNLYYKNKNSLSRLSFDGKTSSLILSGGDYLSYEPRGNHLYVIIADKNKIVLNDYLIKEQKVNKQVELPANGRYRFAPDDRPTLSLYDEKNKTLYLLNPDTLEGLDEPLRGAISWQWLNNNQLLYNNSWEIYLFDQPSGKATLLTRVSEEIVKILWHDSHQYLLFTTAKDLRAFDLRAGAITTLFKAEKISQPILDSQDDLLYFNAQIGQQSGIYKLLLQ